MSGDFSSANSRNRMAPSTSLPVSFEDDLRVIAEHGYEGADTICIRKPPPRTAKGNGVTTVARRFSNGVTTAVTPFRSPGIGIPPVIAERSPSCAARRAVAG